MVSTLDDLWSFDQGAIARFLKGFGFDGTMRLFGEMQLPGRNLALVKKIFSIRQVSPYLFSQRR